MLLFNFILSLLLWAYELGTSLFHGRRTYFIWRLLLSVHFKVWFLMCFWFYIWATSILRLPSAKGGTCWSECRLVGMSCRRAGEVGHELNRQTSWYFLLGYFTKSSPSFFMGLSVRLAFFFVSWILAVFLLFSGVWIYEAFSLGVGVSFCVSFTLFSTHY